MDMESYDSLFLRLKDSLVFSTDLGAKSLIASHFSSALLECNSCVSKTLELVTNLLEETDFQVNRLCEYIENIIILLQMLSDFIKNVLESTAMACCSMKPFPTTTGNIIVTVFMHCKDSEWIYRHHLKSVETQLKDLFRSCHELQLTYLMVLEKHFIFDLTEKEEQELLIEALNINMKIGEIVQALDIKTMAEQWKAYTVICEKYSNFLLDKNIYNKCTKLFFNIITDNIKMVMECGEDKSIVRALKVSNFTIKILTRLSAVFKHASTNTYDRVGEMLEHIYLHNPAFLELKLNKSQQFINLFFTNILIPADGLCNIVLQDERFVKYVHNIDLETLDVNAFLGYIMLIVSIIKAIVQKKEEQVLNFSKRKLIDCIYRILPLGHYWFNMGLKFKSNDSLNSANNYSLYEHLLVHAVALATTFSSEHYAVLEKRMFEAIMTNDCYSATFSSNLWVLLMRIRNDQLLSNTLSSLVKIYQKLEKHKPFRNSPQEVHLSTLIAKLFEVSSSKDKITMSRQIHPQNAMWSVLKVAKLPDPVRRNLEASVMENLKISFHELMESPDVTEKQMASLIQNMKIAATCAFSENDNAIHQYVVSLWTKVCYENVNKYINSEDFDSAEAVWYLRFLEALAALTDCIALKLNSTGLGKILHNISSLLHTCNTVITLLLWDLFCKLTFNRIEDENKDVIDNIFKDTCRMLLRGVESWIKPYTLHLLAKYNLNEQFNEITSELFHEDASMRQEFNLICNVKTMFKNDQKQQELMAAAGFKYSHKCWRKSGKTVENDHCIQHSAKSNFDLGGFLFDDEMEEPSRKKAKLDIQDTESLVESLENNASLLCQMEYTGLDNYRNRIKDVIDKLKNIFS